jgi:tetratricopeptide (TPR) repeat protein
MDTFDEVGDELGRADALKLLGSIAAALAEIEKAGRRFEDALELAREHGNLLLEAEVLEERGELYLTKMRPALARADLEAAAATYRRLGATLRQQNAEERLKQISS